MRDSAQFRKIPVKYSETPRQKYKKIEHYNVTIACQYMTKSKTGKKAGNLSIDPRQAEGH